MRNVLSAVLSVLASSLALGGCGTRDRYPGTSTDEHEAAAATAAAAALPVRPGCPTAAARTTAWTVTDGFCRDVTARGVTLVDWDGFLANPAISITVTPPDGLAYPATLSITSDEPRIYFDPDARPGRSAGALYPAPSDSLSLASGAPVQILVGIFPDHDGASETHHLTFSAAGIETTVPVHVIDQDLGTTPTFPITVSFSQDQAFPDGVRFFLDDPIKQQIAVQAADDWAYFFDGTGLAAVGAGQEATQVHTTAGWYGPTQTVKNASAYTGFLLYALGVDTVEERSTGYPTSNAVYQTAGGKTLPGDLHRSGALEVERLGNYNALGYLVSTTDEDWYLSDNFGDVPNDLKSIIHHEIGHALFFNPGYVDFVPGAPEPDGGVAYGELTSSLLRGYYPGDPAFAGGPASNGLRIDPYDHFSTAERIDGKVLGAIDPASGFGAFGDEYADDGTMPDRRWIITKTDILAAAAVGYPLRPGISSLTPMTSTNAALPGGARSVAYSAALQVDGGVPSYRWTVSSGALPPGLSLDSFAGTIAGTPRSSGTWSFSVTVEDSLGAQVGPQATSLVIR
jgi:hypothetical protein